MQYFVTINFYEEFLMTWESTYSIKLSEKSKFKKVHIQLFLKCVKIQSLSKKKAGMESTKKIKVINSGQWDNG